MIVVGGSGSLGILPPLGTWALTCIRKQVEHAMRERASQQCSSMAFASLSALGSCFEF